MARHNIQFRGIRHTPSDISAQDGDLLECVNLVHENGEMKPIEKPEITTITGIDKNSHNCTLIAVHDLVGTKRFVFAYFSTPDSTVIVKDDTNATALQDFTISGEEVKWAETIGNTLVIGTDKSIHYALFKNGQYNWLGDTLPEPIFKFDFDRDSLDDDGYVITESHPNTFSMDEKGNTHPGGGVIVDGYVDPSVDNEDTTKYVSLRNTTDENKIIVRDSLRAKIESGLKRARIYNRFMFPFFIRYAVRMYDGTYAMHSAPKLMIPSSLTDPILAMLKYENDYIHSSTVGLDIGMDSWVVFDKVKMIPFGLNIHFAGFTVASGTLSDWSDIIKGVDIFMSSQINTYDERLWDDIDKFPVSFCTFNKQEDGEYSEREYGHAYSKNNRFEVFDIYGKKVFGFQTPGQADQNTASVPVSSDAHTSVTVRQYLKIPLPSVNSSTVQQRINDTSLFYRVKQYDIGDLSSSWGGVARSFHSEVERGTLDKLETLPILPDDYISRFKKAAGVWYGYNQRLTIGDMKLELPPWYNDNNIYGTAYYTVLGVCFVIEKGENKYNVVWRRDASNSQGIGMYDFGHYLYYPDPDCTKAIIQVEIKEVPYLKELKMTRHTGLNGSFALMPDLLSLNEMIPELTTAISFPIQSTDLYFHWRNTVAMSKVANVFYFEQFKDIGRTEIRGIAANVLDVSAAQWGQFPLHVFCGDGIFSIDIDREGKMSAVNAVSSDVLVSHSVLANPKLIQTNQMLVFLTQRGVMGIAGTKPQHLSRVMDGRHFNPTSDLKPTSPASVLYQSGAFPSLITAATDTADFRTFASGGFLAYDYAHNRVLLLNANKDYQYVLSMETMMWSKQVPYTNDSTIQVESQAVQNRTLPEISVSHMKAAVNNYTELYLQDSASYLYKAMSVAGENSASNPYKYGYLISRPVRFGTDEYKTITRMLHRNTHYASNSFAAVAVYGSRDGVSYGRLNTLRGMGYRYFIFVVYTYMKPNERYSYMTVDFEPRLTNKLR